MQYHSDQPDRRETPGKIFLAVFTSLVLATIALSAYHMADASAQAIEREYADEATIAKLNRLTYIQHGDRQFLADPNTIHNVKTMPAAQGHTELSIYSYGQFVQRFDFRDADKATRFAKKLMQLDNLPATETSK